MSECDCDECSKQLIGSQGPIGVQGAPSFGHQGPPGYQGSIAIGAQGPIGMQGDTFTGPQGWDGAQGPDAYLPNVGIPGQRGAQGKTDNVGYDGKQGTQGGIGTDAPRGVQGVIGASNMNPEYGRQGERGTQGSSYSGTQGIVGFKGNDFAYIGTLGSSFSQIFPGGSGALFGPPFTLQGYGRYQATIRTNETFLIMLYRISGLFPAPIVNSRRTITANNNFWQSITLCATNLVSGTYRLYAAITNPTAVSFQNCTAYSLA